MIYLLVKAVISGIIIAIVSEVAKRYPGWGAPDRLACRSCRFSR